MAFVSAEGGSSRPYVLGLLRHAKSDYPPGVDDHARPLSARGRMDAPAAGPVIRSRMGQIDMAVVSDAKRARQTWSLAGVESQSVQIEPRIYEAWVDQLMEVVTALPDEVRSTVLVGHNPGFERLAHTLAGEGGSSDALERMSEKYPTCALAVLVSDDPYRQWASANVQLRSFDVCRGN